MKMNIVQFERAVERSLARLPEEIQAALRNIVILVEDRPSRALLEEMGIPVDETLFGLYTGIPLIERSATEPPLYPDEIVIFRLPLLEVCETMEELEDEIEITVAHEVAHYLGIDEDRLAELGYA